MSAFQAKLEAMLVSCWRCAVVARSVPTLAIVASPVRPIPKPQPRIATQEDRSVLVKTLLSNIARLLGRRAVALVVAKEDVLQARLVARQRPDAVVRRRLDDRVGRPLHGDL